jgi:uncharacterized Zn finger protein
MACTGCSEYSFPFWYREVTRLAVDEERHVALYRCNVCGTLWEETAEARRIEEIDESSARERFPGAI